ncbi:MAG: guanylate kinase [Candidatus Omnitrophota bacterium]
MKKRSAKRKGRIVIISGPSGSGKTTLYKKILLSRRLKGKLLKSVSATTRLRRPGERNGRDYFFLTKEKFLRLKKSGQFLEWEKVFSEYYGTLKSQVLKLLRAGKNVLLCIDVKGAETALRQYSDALTVFIKPPSVKILKDRLSRRGSESKTSLSVRLKRVQFEMSKAGMYQYIIVNDHLAKATKELQHIIEKELEK